MIRRVHSALAGEALFQPSQRRRAPVLMRIEPDSEAVVHQGSHLSLGTEIAGGNRTIVVIAATPRCDCGCADPRQAISVTIDPENARAVAAELIAMAAEAEATAAAQAAALLARAAGK